MMTGGDELTVGSLPLSITVTVRSCMLVAFLSSAILQPLPARPAPSRTPAAPFCSFGGSVSDRLDSDQADPQMTITPRFETA
jgi:hypothetical protein